MPRSRATCAIGRPDSNTSRTARSRNSSEYFLGAPMTGASPSPRTAPGFGASKKLRVLHLDHDSYAGTLAHLPTAERERLLNGDWEIPDDGELFRREWFEIIESR